FDDTGSDQSFAIALLDDRRDGVVISSLHGRANTRVFAKPVSDGASPHTLSEEEPRAIRIAGEGAQPGCASRGPAGRSIPRRDGVVISSLHGRVTTRIFAKPVSDGASPHTLSEEEQRAIRFAVEGTQPG